jgi:hypothetical protein
MLDNLQDAYDNVIDSMYDGKVDMAGIEKAADNNLTELLVESALNEKQNQIYQTRAKSGGGFDNSILLKKNEVDRMNYINKINLYDRLSEYYIQEIDTKNKWIYYLKKISYLLLFIVFIFIFKDMFGDISKYDN